MGGGGGIFIFRALSQSRWEGGGDAPPPSGSQAHSSTQCLAAGDVSPSLVLKIMNFLLPLLFSFLLFSFFFPGEATLG